VEREREKKETIATSKPDVHQGYTLSYYVGGMKTFQTSLQKTIFSGRTTFHTPPMAQGKST